LGNKEIIEGVWEYEDKAIENSLISAGYKKHEYPAGILQYMQKRGSLRKRKT